MNADNKERRTKAVGAQTSHEAGRAQKNARRIRKGRRTEGFADAKILEPEKRPKPSKKKVEKYESIEVFKPGRGMFFANRLHIAALAGFTNGIDNFAMIGKIFNEGNGILTLDLVMFRSFGIIEAVDKEPRHGLECRYRLTAFGEEVARLVKEKSPLFSEFEAQVRNASLGNEVK